MLEIDQRKFVYKMSVKSDLKVVSELWDKIDRQLFAKYGNRINEIEYDLRLAFYEGVVNAISHAHHEDGRPLNIWYSLDDDGVQFYVYDTGKGFEWGRHDGKIPELTLEDSRGLFLITSLMDEVYYIQDTHENVLKFYKKIPQKEKNTLLENVAEKTSFETKTVVVFEQDEELFSQIKKTLLKWNLSIHQCKDISEFESYISSGGECNLIYISLDLDNDEFIENIKYLKKLEKSNFIPKLVYSKKREKKNITKAFDYGGNAFVSFPFYESELLSKTKSLIELQQQMRELQDSAYHLTEQLDEAKSLQLATLPPSEQSIRDIHFSSLFSPCSFVGGDMVNYFAIDDDNVGFYVADVSGHGVASAMFSLWLNKTLDPMVRENGFIKRKIKLAPYYKILSPDEVCQELDSAMENSVEKYFTIFYGIINLKESTLEYSCCGHPSPFLLSKDNKVKVIEGSNPPVGMKLGLPFSANKIKLKPGDRIFVFSDCLNESMSLSAEQFGEERILKALSQSNSKSPSDQLQYILNILGAHTEKFVFDDDLTLLNVQYKER